MPTFFNQRLSMPSAFQANAGVALAAAGEALAHALQQFKKTSDVSSSWSGTASKKHEDRAARLADAASRVIQAIARAGTVTNTGAVQMQMLKTQNDATVASALAGQFLVLPTGQVIPGPAHYAQCTGPHGAALMKVFWMIAKMYTAQINGNVAASSATDAQVAATLAVVAIEYFADLLSSKDKDAPTGVPGTQTFTPGLGAGAVPPATVNPITTPNFPSGTQLAGAGSFGGAGRFAGAGGVGAGMTGFGGAGGVGGAGMDGGMPMAAGLMGVGGSAGAAGMAGSNTAAGGRGMAATGGVMPVGTGAGAAGGVAGAGAGAGRASEKERAQAETWLHEDGDAFVSDDDSPGSVLS